MHNEKFLIIGPSWLGDMVMAQALLKSLKVINSNAVIDVAALTWSLPVLHRMQEVNQIIELNLQHGEWSFEKRYQFGKMLQKNDYSHAIVLPNTWKSALIPWFAKIPKRIGWLGEMRFGLLNDIRFLNKSIYQTMVKRYVALAYPAKCELPTQIPNPTLMADQENVVRLMSEFSISNKLPVLALCLGAAFGEAKCWPEEYYIELAKTQIKKNWQVWIFGTNKNLTIEDNSGLIFNFSGKLKLLDVIDLLSLANTVVCNDSGLMHIAASFNKKIVAIYGATSSKFTPPLTKKVKIVDKKLACSPCFARDCPLGHHKCMRLITVEEIAHIIDHENFDN